MRYPSISEEEKRLAEDLLYNAAPIPLPRFAAHFKAKGSKNFGAAGACGDASRAAPGYILEGSKEGLTSGPEAGRTAEWRPWTSSTVSHGRNAGKSVASSMRRADRGRGPPVAEAMKAAVNHLQGFMERMSDAQKGKVVLAP